MSPLDPRTEVAAHFAGTLGPPRVGLEVEVLAIDIATRRPVPPLPAAERSERGMVPLLRRALDGTPWRERESPHGVSCFVHESGGVLSFEPGGQLEYASVPRPSLDVLADELEGVWAPLSSFLETEGIALVARGLDPWNDVSTAGLHLDGPRYRRQARHYDRRGPWGRRMMRQTAAQHVNVDAPGRPLEAWAVANAAAPILMAVFANSDRVAGAPAGVRSARAAQWRRLDPTRTGIFEPSADPVSQYVEFALAADAFLLGEADEPARPFAEWADTATPEEWSRHLTTLFPEVRPRGYLEVRSVDALPLEWTVVPAALLAGLLFHEPSRTEAARRLPPADETALERAGCAGLADAGIASAAQLLFDLAQDGLAALGDAVAGPKIREGLQRFRSEFTDRGRDPGHAPGDRLIG